MCEALVYMLVYVGRMADSAGKRAKKDGTHAPQVLGSSLDPPSASNQPPFAVLL